MSKIHQKVTQANQERTLNETALGFVRYEFVRRLNPRQFHELWSNTMNSREAFDGRVDELIEKEGQ